eukprot:4958342-Pleurochrysis_carterae.AAC.2
MQACASMQAWVSMQACARASASVCASLLVCARARISARGLAMRTRPSAAAWSILFILRQATRRAPRLAVKAAVTGVVPRFQKVDTNLQVTDTKQLGHSGV